MELNDKIKEEVFLGVLTIFNVVDLEKRTEQIEVLDYAGILDLTQGSSQERMTDLLALFSGEEIIVNGYIYRVAVGYELIANIIVDTAKHIKDSTEDTKEWEEEKWEELRSKNE